MNATKLAERGADQAAKEQTMQWVGSNTLLKACDSAAAIVYAVTQPPRVNADDIPMAIRV